VAAAEALAFRVLKEGDPRMAAYALRAAEEDWRFAVEGMAAAGVAASVDLWRATGERRYSEKAVELARVICDSQERNRPDWDAPLLGFFYTGPDKARVLHYCHKGQEHAPIVALTRLCEALPDHPDWMKWYSAVVLHSQYLKTIAGYTEPYGVMPASIYRDDEYLTVPESRRESFRKQVLQGVPLGKGRYLRLFPAWLDYRGHFGTILPQAQALAEAARLRRDPESARLAERQLEWVVGRNPFAQSTMWGEGYDFPPLYSPSSGDMVGGLPVGIQTRGDNDVPYWPVQSTWTYKEIWVYPAAKWLGLMRDLSGPALVEGPAGTAVEFEVSGIMSDSGEAVIKLTARGSGTRRFAIRADNLALSDPAKELFLGSGGEGVLEWRGRIVSRDTPWVAVVYPDDDLSRRKEVMGAVRER
jgi:hypothetical protein